MMEVSYTNNGAEIACVVTNLSGSITTSKALLTVIPDKTPPTVTNVVTDVSFTNVVVYFDKPVNDTALTAVNYKVNLGVTVLSVTRVNQSTVALATTPMAPASTYTLTINGVYDTAATPYPIAANTQIQFLTFGYASGVILHKKYNNCSDSYSLADFFADPRYPNNPDREDIEPIWEYPPLDVQFPSAADPVPNWCDTLEGYFIPPATTNYVFFICGDDEFYLYLSTDDSPANMYQICQEPGGWTERLAWTTGQDTEMAPLRSDENTNTAWPSGTNISLIAGTRYYMLSMHHCHSWSGDDAHAVTYKMAGAPDPMDGDAPLLTGSVVGYYFNLKGESISIIRQPQSATVLEESTTTNFSALATGTSDYDNGTNVVYQWQFAPKGSTAWTNIPNATSASYSTSFMPLADNGDQFRVIANLVASYATSSVATLTVVANTNRPTVTKVDTDLTLTRVVVCFSEPVSATALTASNYQVNQGVTVSSVTRVNATTVALTTSTLALGGVYTLTINGVQDLAATPNTIAPNTQVQFEGFVYEPGSIVHKKYNDCSDAYTVTNFFADPRYPNNPDRVDLEPIWEYPPGGSDFPSAADPVPNYCDTLEGFFIPPATTNYVFFTSGDDEFYLYLSTDDSPANMYQICQNPDVGWTSDRYWETGQGTPPLDMAPLRSDENTNTAWPHGNTITLTKGQRYYMLSMHHTHSWSGGNYFGVTYKEFGAPDPTNGAPPLLTGNVIGYDIDPNGTGISFSQQPQGVTTVEGTSANFSVLAAGTSDYANLTNNLSYQWQLAPNGSTTWTNITGATNTAYSTFFLGLADNRDQLRVIAGMGPILATSSVAILTVLADTNPPVVSVGAMMDPAAGTVDVGVGFNKTVDDAAGSLLSNYSLSSGTVTSFTWCTNRFTTDSQNPLAMVRKQSALLTVTGLSGSATLTVKNMTDIYGNKLVSTNVPFTVSANLTWGVVGANVLGGWNAAVPVGPGDFDVYSDGIAEGGTYDETTFVYEQVTGNFDKKLRVEYQDGSSEWAKAGIVVRDSPSPEYLLDFGMSSNLQTGATGATNTAPPYDGLAGRYQKCHVDPVGLCLTLNAGAPVLGAASWEGDRRLDTGGATTSCLTNVSAVPDYPNVWCRIQRTNQTFTIFGSADGVNWELLGQTTWGPGGDSQTGSNMPPTVYVGPEFSPENGNITLPGDQGTFLAQFRDYGDTVPQTSFNPQLTTGFSAGQVTITWTTGTLVSSPTVNGTYTTVTNATSPYVVSPPTGPAMFYRVMQ
jgi:hypothetical protein